MTVVLLLVLAFLLWPGRSGSSGGSRRPLIPRVDDPTPRAPAVLGRLREGGLEIDVARTTFFLGRETLIATKRPGMAMWRERLFALLSRNARRATKFFRLPPDRVCELGTEIEL